MKILHTRAPFFLYMLLMFVFMHYGTAQVGIGSAAPQAALDISSTDSGLLLPRVALTSATVAAPVTNPNGGAIVDGTMIWNTGTGGVTPAGFYYWQGNRWSLVGSDSQPQVYFGKFIINALGVVTISGVPFLPTSIEFTAVNRVQDYNARAYRSSTAHNNGNNSYDIKTAGGQMTGFAQNIGGTISQQVISHGFNGSSLNNIGTYASDAHCIAAFFVDNNGQPIRDNGNATGSSAVTQEGLIRASLTSFTHTGFILDVDRFLTGIIAGGNDRTNQIVVTFKAYR